MYRSRAGRGESRATASAGAGQGHRASGEHLGCQYRDNDQAESQVQTVAASVQKDGWRFLHSDEQDDAELAARVVRGSAKPQRRNSANGQPGYREMVPQTEGA